MSMGDILKGVVVEEEAKLEALVASISSMQEEIVERTPRQPILEGGSLGVDSLCVKLGWGGARCLCCLWRVAVAV